jgi:hypothetical protein
LKIKIEAEQRLDIEMQNISEMHFQMLHLFDLQVLQLKRQTSLQGEFLEMK